MSPRPKCSAHPMPPPGGPTAVVLLCSQGGGQGDVLEFLPAHGSPAGASEKGSELLHVSVVQAV